MFNINNLFPACDASQRHRLILLRWVEQTDFADHWDELLTSDAWDDIARTLYKRLEVIATPTLDSMLQKHLLQINPVAEFGMNLTPAEDRIAASAALMNELESSDCTKLWEAAPLLREKLDECAANFIFTMNEMLLRIKANISAISDVLLNGSDGFHITGLACDGGDLHAHGRSAVIVTTDHGKFVYKPRDCTIDKIYAELIDRYFPDITYAPRCITRKGYGFCEFIVPENASTHEEALKYFRNFGGLAAVFQFLGSSDLHIENFLMKGIYPVLIDHETIISPSPAVFTKDQAGSASVDFVSALNGSLFASSLLPHFSGGNEFSPLMNSAQRERGLPIVDGRVVTAFDYKAELLEGFEHIYRRCMSLKAELAEMLEMLRDIPVRRLVRATNYYALIQKRLHTPAALADDESQRKATAALQDYFIKTDSLHMRAIADAEERSLLRGDIPYFYAIGDGHDLMADGELVVKGFFKTSGVENARVRLANMDESELTFEKSLLNLTISNSVTPLSEPRAAGHLESSDIPMLSDEQFIAAAENIFADIRNHALIAPNGTPGWLYNPEGVFRNMGVDLIHGHAGLGVFFATLYSVSGNQQALLYAHMCLEKIEAVISAYEETEYIPHGSMSAGLDGVGGIIRALIHMSSSIDDAASLAERLGAVALRMNFDTSMPDVIAGTAGLLSAAAHLETAVGKSLVKRCGKLLLDARSTVTDDGTYLWNTLRNSRILSGMGHGMAGIGAALMKAYNIDPDPGYVTASKDAFNWEHRIYSEQLNTWPDLRNVGSPRAMHGFCSGAPGIGLALLSCRENQALLPFWKTDLNRAIRACVNRGALFRDHLCCGNSASVDLLLEAGYTFQRADLIEAGRRLLSIMTLRGNGSYSYLPSGYREAFISGLFFGAAGIGLELLRAADSSVPSILI